MNAPSPQLLERVEENANLVLWCVHVLGPDDIIAAATHAEAVTKAEELNAAIHARDSEARDVLCFAYADVWPWSKEAHSDGLKKRDGAA